MEEYNVCGFDKEKELEKLHNDTKKAIMEKYNNLCEDIQTSYKNESFDKFEDLWKSCIAKELCYDDILYDFEEKAKEQFDYIELGTLDIYTDSEYELEI